jgi:hypothetical protein
MTATLVQSATNGVTGTSVAQTLGTGGTNPTGIPVTAGNTIIVYGICQIANRTLTVSDNIDAGNYNQDSFNNSRVSLGIYSFPGVVGGNTTITLTQSGSSAVTSLIAEEWSGILTTIPKDTTASANGISTGGTSSSTGVLSQASELAVGTVGLASGGSAITIAAPFTISPSIRTALAAGNYQQNSTSALTVTFNWTGSVNFQINLVTYKLTAAAGPPPFYNRRSVLYFT